MLPFLFVVDPPAFDRPSRAAMITVNMTDGKTGNEYVVVPSPL